MIDNESPELPGPAPSITEVVNAAEVRHVIVRACLVCGAARQRDQPCEGCGNTTPAEVHDLGVVTATYSNPLRQAWWLMVRKPLADRRIQRANRRATNLRANKE